MKKTVYAIALATGLGLFASAAMAQPPGFYRGPANYPGYYGNPAPAYSPGPGYMSTPEDRLMMAEEWLDWMQDRLLITDAQRPAWNKLRGRMIAQIEGYQALRDTLKERGHSSDPLARDARRIAMMEHRLASMKAVAEARKELFAVLTDAQKERAERAMKRHQGRHPGDRHRGGYPGDWRHDDRYGYGYPEY